MDTSILFLKILALYFVVSGLFLLFKGKTLPFILKDFFNHPAIVFLTGIILLFLGGGVLIQIYASVSDSLVQVLVIIFGWLVLLKGLSYIFMPKALENISLKKFDSWFGVLGVFTIIIGVVLFFAV
jgi:uncharacterized membrane protein HdeD (DUF308 family)